jgi:IS605 OrfB family transposase
MRSANKVALHKALYKTVREKYNLPAQLATRAIAKVCEVYKRDKSIKPVFRSNGAISFDDHCFTPKDNWNIVSVISLTGRIKIKTFLSEYQQSRLSVGKIHNSPDLVLKNNDFYLYIPVEYSEEPIIIPKQTLGIDLGIVNVAADNTGTLYSGKKIHDIRNRHMILRKKLQKAGTRSAKRHLKRLSGKEARFVRDTNHCISKEIVRKAKGTRSAIALEDLTNIRKTSTVRKAQRYEHNSWAFYQLRSFIEYKAKMAGIPVYAIDPRNTSRECLECHTIDKKNRPKRDRFRCIGCGFVGHADTVAAMNIAARAPVSKLMVSGGPGIMLDQTSKPVRLGTSPRHLYAGN